MKFFRTKTFLIFISFLCGSIQASQAPISIQQYVQFSSENIRLFNKQFQASFRQPIDNTFHILSDQNQIDNLVNVARKINDLYSGNIIVSVGQSPAYIVKTAHILSQQKYDIKTRYEHLAFSGKLLQEEGVQDTTKKFVLDAGKIPTDAQVAGYIKYLQSVQMDPQAIVNRFNKNSQKTIFMDFIISANGFASFIYIVNMIARRQHVDQNALQKAIGYHAFQRSDAVLPFNVIHIKDGPLHTYLCHLHKNNLQIVEAKLIFSLAQAIMNINFNDRIVAEYPTDKWGVIDPKQLKLSNNARLLIFKIIDHIAARKRQSDIVQPESVTKKKKIEKNT